MLHNNYPGGGLLDFPQYVPSGAFGSYVGCYTDRQRRFEVRSVRRSGDWFILDVPTVVLWVDVDTVPEYEYEY